MSLYNRVLPGTKNLLMVQRREEALKPLPGSKAQEEKANEHTNLINALNSGNPDWWQEELPHHHPLHKLALK